MSSELYTNNRRIAKNTLLLYARMFLMFAITLYTSRIVLQTLGVTDYGIYNVVGGVISMFGFLVGAMTTSTQRYITYNLAKEDVKELKKVFSTTIIIHILIALIILILGETIGLWFVKNKLVIPEERMNAAMWVYQLSILTSLVQIISVPYNADIIAHEKMSAFAYISILEAVLKLAIVYFLLIISYDKLITYSVLVFLVGLLIRYVYSHYCKRHFEESHFKMPHDKKLFKEIFSFAGWNFWGNLAGVLFGQGLNILLNMFFGPVVNAARGVAVQVQNAITQFSINFQTALNPQITKTYAAGEFETMHTLIFRSSKFTFILLFILCFPVIIETPMILEMWLGRGMVPEDTVIFVRLMLCVTMIDAMANPLMVGAAATGDVKKYQSVIGGILLAIVPISYVVLKLGGAAWAVFLVHLIICIIAFVVRLWIISPMINLSLHVFAKRVVLPCFALIFVSAPIPVVLYKVLSINIVNGLLIILVSVLLIAVSAYYIELTKNERVFLREKVTELLSNFRKR